MITTLTYSPFQLPQTQLCEELFYAFMKGGLG
jgi:hypothetical protein